jgi:sec-independent protein translocase protein TatC
MADTPTNPDRRDPLNSEMPFGEHLEELRRRLIYALLAIVPLFIVALAVGEPVMWLLFKPMNNAQLDYGNTPQYETNGPFEYFNAYCYVAVILTIIVGLPWVLYQGWKFVAPGLYTHEKRFAYTLIPMSVGLAAVGVAFMYLVMLPVVMSFFLTFSGSVPGEKTPVVDTPTVAAAPAGTAPPVGGPHPGTLVSALASIPEYPGDPKDPKLGQMWVNTYLHQLRIALLDSDGKSVVIYSTAISRGSQLIRAEYRVADYIDMVFDFAVAFAIAFQAPVVVLLLGWAGILDPALMRKYRRHSIMVCTVLGAVLTPADPISIFLLAIPLYGLYELGLALLRWLPASRVAGRRRTEGEAPDPEASGP